jgi:hypothetical protein
MSEGMSRMVGQQGPAQKPEIRPVRGAFQSLWATAPPWASRPSTEHK